MNPYIIGPYQESDAYKFKGRSSEIEGMFRSFIQNDYLVCYAESGEGKSSILNAGLFPRLRQNRYFPISIRFKFDDPDVKNMDFDKVMNAAIDKALGESSSECTFLPSSLIFETDQEETAELQKSMIAEYAWLRLRYSELLTKGEKEELVRMTPVLVFDQFEEVFTNPESQIWTSNFFKWLEEISTDVCPQRIISAISEIEDDMPLMASIKRFKAIFSLRSEYVGDVDYWGLQHCYIPDLKNNRYFLKPLTPQGAKEVVNQPEGLEHLSDFECSSLISGCASNHKYVDEGLPCIPASILSILCHEIYEYNDHDRSLVLKSLNNERNKAVEMVLEKYYLNILAKCKISDDRHRDALENALVDDKGNRKRIGIKNQDLSIFSQDQLKQLQKENMLRVVSKSESGDGDVVELPHDKFCLIIKNHKNKRFKEIQERNKSLKEWLYFGVLSVALGIFAVLMHFHLIEMLRPAINSFISDSTRQEVIDALCGFIRHDNIATDYYLSFITCVSLILVVILLPLQVIGTAKKWKKFTVATSVISLCLSAWFIKLGDITETSPGFLIFVSLLISLCILASTIARWRKTESLDLSAWPLWGSWFLFFSYLYWEFVRCLIIGINEPVDSSAFIVILPTLLLLWTLTFYAESIESKEKKKKCWQIATLVLFSVSLVALTINAMSSPYLGNNKFPYWATNALLITAIASITLILKGIFPVHKRIIAISINTLAILTIYTFNLGYNPFKVDYNSVWYVANWRATYVLDHNTNLLGICDPVSGDTIIPPSVCKTVFSPYEITIVSDKFKRNPFKEGGFRNRDGSFIWEGDTAKAKFISVPTLEEYIKKATKTPKDSLEFLSATLYRELRSLNIDYAYNTTPYKLSDIKSLDALDSLLSKMLDNTLTHLLKSKDIDHPDRDKLDIITDSDLYKFYEVITRNFHLHLIKDRIYNEDFPSVITLIRMYPAIYFYSAYEGQKLPVNLEGKVTLNSKTLISYFKTSLYPDDILDQKCFVWYNLFIGLCILDNQFYNQTYQERTQASIDETVNMIKELGPKLKELLAEEPKKLDLDFDIDNASYEELLTYKTDLLYQSIWRGKVTTIISPYIEAESLLLPLDKNFDVFSNKVIDAMLQILESKQFGLYNSAFEDICKNLLVVRLFRGYDITEQLNKIKKVDERNDAFLKSYSELDSVATVSKKQIQTLLNELYTLAK